MSLMSLYLVLFFYLISLYIILVHIKKAIIIVAQPKIILLLALFVMVLRKGLWFMVSANACQVGMMMVSMNYAKNVTKHGLY